MRKLACAAVLFAISTAGALHARAQAEEEPAIGQSVVLDAAEPETAGPPPSDPPSAAFANDPDWQAIYSAPRETSGAIRISQSLGTALVRRLLLMPGDLHVESTLDSVSAKIAAFRERHPAVAFGEHEPLVNDSYAFRRYLRSPRADDDVVIVFDAAGKTTVNVSRAFPDDTLVRDAMTGSTAFISFGMARFEAHPSGYILIEEVP